MITQIPSKTYSRKRRRALSDLTDSPSTNSPSSAAVSASSKNIQDAKRKLTTRTHTTAISNASGSTEEASPERPMKKLKRHSSSTATLARVPQPIPLQTALPPHPQYKMASSEAISSHASLLLGSDTGPQLASASELIKTSTSSLHHSDSGQKQSSAGHHLPFRRTRSQTQKENILSHPQALGSPFQVAPASSLRPHTSGVKAAKQLRPSKFVRRPSADVFRAHTSPSAHFRRRPSGSHALQKNSTRNQDWLVAPRIPPSAEGNAAPFDPDIDLDKLHSFFAPQGSSTPLPTKRPIHHGTPMTPTPSIPFEDQKLSTRQLQDIVMSDTTSIPGESFQSSGAASDPHVSTSSPRDPHVVGGIQRSTTEHPHRIVHLPHDSIFSSFDVSASATTVRVLVNPRLAHDEVVKEPLAQDSLPSSMRNRTDKAPVPEGDKLHDMFSVLALAEQKKQGPSEDSGIEMNKTQASLSVEEAKGVNHDCGLPQTKKTILSKESISDEKISVPGGKKPATRKRKQGFSGINTVSPPSAHQNVPKRRVQVYADSEPLFAADDEDDELLLTSKGWDWDPQGAATLK